MFNTGTPFRSQMLCPVELRARMLFSIGLNRVLRNIYRHGINAVVLHIKTLQAKPDDYFQPAESLQKAYTAIPHGP